MDYINSLTWIAFWPILIFIAYKFVAFNVEAFETKTK
ncbi:MAG: hypothetical protein RL154_319 [Pseudomonadota bacterium]|jgi:hypothetical protein